MQKTCFYHSANTNSSRPFVSRLAYTTVGCALLVFNVIGCAGNDSFRDDETSNEQDAEPPAKALRWSSCPDGFEDQCAHLSVPLNREVEGSGQIEVMISKRAAARGAAEAQLWLLMGGPGNSADLFEYLGTLDQLAKAMPGVDIYTIEHRGVGESTKLECPDGDPTTSEQIEACLSALDEQYPGQLAAFSTTEAAHDTEYALSLTRDEGIPQFLYGVSYGTYLAERYLVLHPEGVSGVILDSVVPPPQKLNGYDVETDTIAERIAERCAQDPVCSEKLGATPWSFVKDVVSRVEQGHCPEAGVQDMFGPILSAYLTVGDLREVVLPLIYRLDRCEPEDAIAMQNSLAYMQSTTPDLSRNGNVLRVNVAVSELWDRTASEAELLSACDDVTFCPGVGAMMLPFVQGWPSYEDPLIGQWPKTDAPILTMNGDLDAQTPIETAVSIQDHYTGEYQYFVEFKDGPHGLVDGTPVTDPNAPNCAAQLVADFVADPKDHPDVTCLSTLVGMDFSGKPERAMEILGMADLWENDAP